MATVKYAISDYIADGTTTDYLITWDYLDEDHIAVYVDGTSNADPTANHTFTKINATTLRITDGVGGAIVAGSAIEIRRETPITTRPISFADGSALLAADLNKNSDYLLFAMQESLDTVDTAAQNGAQAAQAATEAFRDETEGFKNETLTARNTTQTYLATVQSDATDADNHRIAAGASETAAAASEAASAASESASAASEAAAAASETAAATSEVNAAASEAASATSEAAAAASETAAATSETNAANSASAAATSASEAAASAASINPDSIDINGGTIDGTVIGGTTPAAGSFTTGSFTGDVSFGDNDKAIFGAANDLEVDADSLSSRIAATGLLQIVSPDSVSLGGAVAGVPNMVVDPAVGTLFLDSNGATVAIIPNSGLAIESNVDLDVTGTVDATAFVGDGSALTGLPAGYTDSDVDAHLNYSTATTGQILSYSGTDYDWVDASSGGGLFKGDNGTSGNTSTGAADIFRVNEQTLNTNTTIDADENASATGPLAIATGVTLTVTTGGNLSIV